MRLTETVKMWHLLLTANMTALYHCGWLSATKCHVFTYWEDGCGSMIPWAWQMSRLLTYWSFNYSVSIRLTIRLKLLYLFLLTENMTALRHCPWLSAAKCHHILLTETMTTVFQFHLTKGYKMSRLPIYWNFNYAVSMRWTISVIMSYFFT